jgi:hypothetical protein
LVTVTSSSLFLGDLAERLTQQTGVPISLAGEGAGDYRICCAIKERPLVEVMDAVWSLMSYRAAEWHWERRKGSAGLSYRLMRTLPARRLAQELRGQLDEQFDRHYETMMRAVASPEDPGPPPDTPEGKLLSSPRLRTGLQLFARAVPAEKRKAIVLGGAVQRISVSDLDADGQAFVEGIWQKSMNPNSTAALPRPEWIEFRTTRFGGYVSPSLFIQVQGLGGYAYLGGDPLEKQSHAALDERWQLPGDLRPEQAPELKEPALSGAGLSRPSTDLLAVQVRKLAEELGVPVLAYLPRGQRAVSISRPASVAQLLQQLKAKEPYLVSKVRGGVLLLRYRAWFQQEEDPPALTWEFFRKIRKTLGEPENTAPLSAYCRVASLATVPQLIALAEDYPLLAAVAFWREPLAYLARNEASRRKLVAPRGIALRELVGPVPLMSMGLNRALAAGKFTTLRLEIEREDSPTDWQLTLLLGSENGNEVPVLKLFPPPPEGIRP